MVNKYFNSNNTFAVFKKCIVNAILVGGGGGGAGFMQPNTGIGGGGAGYMNIYNNIILNSGIYSINIGLGGNPGRENDINNCNGGTGGTTYISNTNMSALGGSGGTSYGKGGIGGLGNGCNGLSDVGENSSVNFAGGGGGGAYVINGRSDNIYGSKYTEYRRGYPYGGIWDFTWTYDIYNKTYNPPEANNNRQWRSPDNGGGGAGCCIMGGSLGGKGCAYISMNF